MTETTEKGTANLALHLTLSHRIITRALQVIGQSCPKFGAEGFPDAATREGFACYVQSFASFLHAHHSAEEELMFPFLQTRLPEAPYAMLIRQHKAMVPLVNHVATVANGLVSGTLEAGQLGGLHHCAERLAEGWSPHFKAEEQHFTAERLAQHLSPEEHNHLCRQLAEYTRHHLQPPYLVIPFALFNLPPAERASLAAMLSLPREEQLPGEWQEKWQVMRPFLLE